VTYLDSVAQGQWRAIEQAFFDACPSAASHALVVARGEVRRRVGVRRQQREKCFKRFSAKRKLRRKLP
jgi:hypothetical protein